MGVLVLVLIALNFGISWFNAWSVGTIWAESKALGGFARFFAWMGATMSASGFTWCYTIVLAYLAAAFHWLPLAYAQGMIQAGYLVVIFPILGSGLTIMLMSWVAAYKRRTIGSYGVAGWNTFAQVYNTYNAIREVPNAFKGVSDLLGKGKKDLGWLMLMMVVIALVGGILTTATIIRKTAHAHVKKVVARAA